MQSSKPDGSSNLLCDLNKWAKQQDENFVTDAFVHLLRYLLSRQSPLAQELLLLLTKNEMAIPPCRLREVSVKTQVSTAGGRLDIEIATPDVLLYVEVKVDWKIDADGLSKQLTKYRRVLDSRGHDRCRLLGLLTRFPVPELLPSASPALRDAVGVRGGEPERWPDAASAGGSNRQVFGGTIHVISSVTEHSHEPRERRYLRWTQSVAQFAFHAGGIAAEPATSSQRRRLPGLRWIQLRAPWRQELLLGRLRV